MFTFDVMGNLSNKEIIDCNRCLDKWCNFNHCINERRLTLILAFYRSTLNKNRHLQVTKINL